MTGSDVLIHNGRARNQGIDDDLYQMTCGINTILCRYVGV